MKNLVAAPVLMAMLAVGTASAQDVNAPRPGQPVTRPEQARDAQSDHQASPATAKPVEAASPHGGTPIPASIRKTSFTEASIPKSRDDKNHRTITLYLPLTASDLQTSCEMRNSPWGDGEADFGPPVYRACDPNHGECSIGWAKIRNLQVHTTPTNVVVSADFYNWSDANTRWGKLSVTYTP